MIGYEADTVDSAGTRNYQGVFAAQTIKTAGKLSMARNVANMDLVNAQLALRKTRYDLLSRVKAAYFNVLVAQQSVAITSAMAWLTNEAFRIQVDKLRLGEGTGYEPAQLRSLAVQARAAQIQAENQYIASWKQLAALIGIPDLPTAQLDGRADMPAPVVNYDVMLARVLNNHPDVLTARNLQAQARMYLALQRKIPIPDVQLYGTFQRDFTTPSVPRTVYNVQFGLPIPIFDRNRGNITNAEGQLPPGRRASPPDTQRTDCQFGRRLRTAGDRALPGSIVSRSDSARPGPRLPRRVRPPSTGARGSRFRRHHRCPAKSGRWFHYVYHCARRPMERRGRHRQFDAS